MRWGRRVGDCLLDQRGELVDLAAEGVDLVQQHPRQLGVVVVEAAAVRACTRAACLTRSRPLASSANSLGACCPAISASIMARPETPRMSVATVESLLRASSGSLLQPLLVAGAVGGQVGTEPGVGGHH